MTGALPPDAAAKQYSGASGSRSDVWPTRRMKEASKCHVAEGSPALHILRCRIIYGHRCRPRPHLKATSSPIWFNARGHIRIMRETLLGCANSAAAADAPQLPTHAPPLFPPCVCALWHMGTLSDQGLSRRACVLLRTAPETSPMHLLQSCCITVQEQQQCEAANYKGLVTTGYMSVPPHIPLDLQVASTPNICNKCINAKRLGPRSTCELKRGTSAQPIHGGGH